MSNEMAEIRVNQNIVFREEEEGAFLFDPDSGRIFHLNEVGTYVWKSCMKAKRPEQIIQALCLDFSEISHKQIERDCMKFFDDLGRLGFLASEA
ncbi:MAG: PqqD family protein [Deltaproteobacteria bacterium]|nr:PqqD family protein [Deltaproteobacteria bacterium]